MNLQALDAEGKIFEFNPDMLKGQTTVLYFYPKDNTSGCTKEACDFRDNLNRLTRYAQVIGVSPDNIDSHIKFQQRQNLNFTLVSDTEHTLSLKFDVWKEKSMYGRKYMGIERSSFILNKQGNIIKEWRKVKVKSHVEEIITFLQTL